MNKADETAIRNLCARWLSATAAGDHAAVLELMVDDVVFITPGRPPMVGKAAFAALQPPPDAGIRIEATQDIAEVVICADLAFSRSHLQVTVTSPQLAQAVTRTGHTLTVYQRQADGNWRVLRDANTLLLDTHD